jgi:hypothetical protein
VFNAVENFVDLDARSPASPAATPTPPPASPLEPLAATPRVEPAPEPDHDPAPILKPAQTAFDRFEDEQAEAPFGEIARPPAVPAESAVRASDNEPRAEADARTAPLPRFVRQADRAARWRSRPLRLTVTALSVLLAALLGAQAVYTWRDTIAARAPALKPALLAACGVLQCTIGPARRIADLGVEASGLLRVEKSSLYKLSLTLRNRADIALALPALDLSLTDGEGRLVARRVLSPTELGLAAATIAAGQDLPIQAVLQLGREAPAVSGYTVELFYP